MSAVTKKSSHPYYHVMIDANVEAVTLCVTDNGGFGGYDYWKVDKTGYKRVGGIEGKHHMTDYWHDSVGPLEIIQNVYKVLDFYAGIEDNYEEEMEEACNNVENLVSFTADDIPF